MKAIIEKMLLSVLLNFVVAIPAPTFDFKFDDFMGIINEQTAKEKARAEQYTYVGEPEVDASDYRKDRHGGHYITCENRNDLAGLETMTVRCMLRPNHHRAACMYTYDFNTNTTTQGCFDVLDENHQCEKECNVSVNRHSTPPDVKLSHVTVGFCCCTKSDCNVVSETQRQEAYNKFTAKEERHHHSRRETRLSTYRARHYGDKLKILPDNF